MANIILALVLVWTCPQIWSKGIILYGKGKVVANKKASPAPTLDDSEDGGDNFQFSLYTPTRREATASESFRKFSHQAITATLAGNSRRRIYYFMQERKNYETEWMSDPNVCQAEAKAWQLHPNGGFLFTDSEQRVTVYFLCDQFCCGTQCCDLNVTVLVCMILFIILGLSITIWLCFRYGRPQCQRAKEAADEEFVDAEEYLPPVTLHKFSNAPHISPAMSLKRYHDGDVQL